MAFDGSRAIIVGDYVTPSSGAYAGQLGPWASFLSKVGLDPRSTGVKVGMVILGLGSIVAGTAFFLSAGWSRTAVAALAVLVLWYAPFGTVIGAFALIMMVWNGIK